MSSSSSSSFLLLLNQMFKQQQRICKHRKKHHRKQQQHDVKINLFIKQNEISSLSATTSVLIIIIIIVVIVIILSTIITTTITMVTAYDEKLLISKNYYYNNDKNYLENDSKLMRMRLINNENVNNSRPSSISIHNFIKFPSLSSSSSSMHYDLAQTTAQQQYSIISSSNQYNNNNNLKQYKHIQSIHQQQQQQQQHYYQSQIPFLSQHQHQQQQQQQLQYPYSYNVNNSWNRVFKLILLSFVSTIGTMGAIFIISAITVIDTFQVRGNCFLVSLSFGHLLVTILILPSSAIAIMANITEDITLCHFQWLITLACFIVSLLSFLFMSIDNYFGMKSLLTYKLFCTKCRICFLIIIIWLIAFIIPFLQHSNHFGPEFCQDKHHWKINTDYHPYVLGFIILFTIITLAYFTYSLFMYKNYKIQFESSPEAANLILTDGCLLQSNVIVYICSLAMWLPLIVTMVVDSINPVPQDYLDTVWYIAISNSCSYSYLYAATNRDFRDAFNKLFYYCCCKSHVTFSRKGAAIRRTVANESLGLRVHIIPGLNIYAQRKDNLNSSTNTGGGDGFGTSSYRSGGFGSSGFNSSGGIGGGGGVGSFFNKSSGSHSAMHIGHYYYNRSHKSCEL